MMSDSQISACIKASLILKNKRCKDDTNTFSILFIILHIYSNILHNFFFLMHQWLFLIWETRLKNKRQSVQHYHIPLFLEVAAHLKLEQGFFFYFFHRALSFSIYLCWIMLIFFWFKNVMVFQLNSCHITYHVQQQCYANACCGNNAEFAQILLLGDTKLFKCGILIMF